MTRTLSIFLAVLVLAGCQPEPFGRSSTELRDERLQCEADGGRFERGGLSAAMLCFRETPDAGADCRKSTDCTSACLARENGEGGYCAAVTPLFGCFDMFDERGQRVAICID